MSEFINKLDFVMRIFLAMLFGGLMMLVFVFVPVLYKMSDIVIIVIWILMSIYMYYEIGDLK